MGTKFGAMVWGWLGVIVFLMLGLIACDPQATALLPTLTPLSTATTVTQRATTLPIAPTITLPTQQLPQPTSPPQPTPSVTPTTPSVVSPTPPTTVATSTPAAPVSTVCSQAGRAGAGLGVREAALALRVYPYEKYLSWSVDAQTGVPYAKFKREAFEAAKEPAAMQTFKTVVLENELLALTILPALGGRLYQVVYKPTQQKLFYNNPVVKPSRWGPFESNQNWWLAVGGMEWATPVQEHGYEWGSPWGCAVNQSADAISVRLMDVDEGQRTRLQASVTLTLRRGEAAWTVNPVLYNPTERSMRVQFWLNAMLTLGTNTIAPDTQFNLPAQSVIVHSTGDKRLPGEKQVMSWPIAQGINLAEYRHWQNWLGVFAPTTTGSGVGALSTQNRLGVTREFDRQTTPGVKLFAFGPQFPDRSYTEDDSQYFELWGGLNKTFWPEDDVTLAPGANAGWSERWVVWSP